MARGQYGILKAYGLASGDYNDVRETNRRAGSKG